MASGFVDGARSATAGVRPSGHAAPSKGEAECDITFGGDAVLCMAVGARGSPSSSPPRAPSEPARVGSVTCRDPPTSQTAGPKRSYA